MSCQLTPPFIELPPAFSTCTWPGLTWRIDATDSTEFDAVLASAAFQLQTESGTAALTLTSATAGQVTLNNTAAKSWDVTIDPRILSLAAGNYSWALETTDADGVVKPVLIGSLRINPDPIL